MFPLTKYAKSLKDSSRKCDLFCSWMHLEFLKEHAILEMFIYSVLHFCNLGLGSKHIYLKNGNSSNVAELLESFKKDARSVKLRAGKHQLEDVTDVLKSFLSQIDDAILTKELYPFWISALGNK